MKKHFGNQAKISAHKHNKVFGCLRPSTKCANSTQANLWKMKPRELETMKGWWGWEEKNEQSPFCIQATQLIVCHPCYRILIHFHSAIITKDDCIVPLWCECVTMDANTHTHTTHTIHTHKDTNTRRARDDLFYSGCNMVSRNRGDEFTAPRHDNKLKRAST